MNRKLEYKQYLNSKGWKELRSAALARTDGFCQFCGDIATQVHHAKYPKRFGEEHPHSLIPACDKCHAISHGIQKMNELKNVVQMAELAPNGNRLNYLMSGGRVFASAKSWSRALQLPESLMKWFEAGLANKALFKKDTAGGSLEMQYSNTAVYRWHAVGDLLRAFDREWYKTEYRSRPIDEQREIQRFHESYERLVNWGYDLQERALASMLNSENDRNTPVTQETLLEAIKQAVAPRLIAHDDKLHEHDVMIADIKEAVSTLRDPLEFITVKQAISEQGLDPSVMPLHPQSKDNLAGLAGKRLKAIFAEEGGSVIARLDGQNIATKVNTYRRKAIFEVLQEIIGSTQSSLL